MSGVPVIAQVADAVLVTALPEQLSLPRAVTVEVMEQSLPAGTM